MRWVWKNTKGQPDFRLGEMNTSIKVLSFVLGLITIIILTITGIIYIQANTWPKSVPNGDIFFQSEDDQGYLLNFINADGSGHQDILLKQQIIKPVWSADGDTVYGLSNPKFTFPYSDIGYPAYWDIKQGKFKDCSNNQPYYAQIEEYESTNDQHLVLLSNNGEIVTFDFDTCKVVKILINYEGQFGTYNIYGISYQPSTQTLLFGRIVNPYDNPYYQIIKFSIESGKEEVIGEGLNPSWSKDGSKISYFGPEGIVIIDSTDYQPILLVRYKYINSDFGDLKTSTPLLRWSPDSEWLVVHQCIEAICKQKYSVIKVIHVSDGYQEQIFTGGRFPAWMP